MDGISNCLVVQWHDRQLFNFSVVSRASQVKQSDSDGKVLAKLSERVGRVTETHKASNPSLLTPPALHCPPYQQGRVHGDDEVAPVLLTHLVSNGGAHQGEGAAAQNSQAAYHIKVQRIKSGRLPSAVKPV